MRWTAAAFSFLLAAALAACDDDPTLARPGDGGPDEGQGDNTNPTDPGGADFATIDVRLRGVDGAVGATPGWAPGLRGQATAGQIDALEYYVLSMGICTDAEIQGSGFNMGGRCIVLYAAPQPAFQDAGGPTLAGMSRAELESLHDAARDDDSGHYIDLVDPASRTRLNRAVTITTEHAGQYAYGYVYWAYPIRVAATIDLSDGTTLRTHDGSVAVQTIGVAGYREISVVSPTSLTSGTTQTAVVLHNNGGTWFRFQEPFAITPADVTGGTTFTLDLAFNPHGIVKGYGPGSHGSGMTLRDTDPGGDPAAGYGIELPLLDLAPVPHRATETALREAYVFDVSTPTGNRFAVRYDLYVVAEDPARVIRAVETKVLYTPDTIANVGAAANVAFVTTDADGTVSFLSYDRHPLLSGLQRGTAAGDGVAATYHCRADSGEAYDFCDADGTLPATGHLAALAPVE